VRRAFAQRLREAAAELTIVCTDTGVSGTTALHDLPRGDGFDFEATWQAVQPEDVLTLIYTSGTTGAPKPVELTHQSMVAEVLLAARRWSFGQAIAYPRRCRWPMPRNAGNALQRHGLRSGCGVHRRPEHAGVEPGDHPTRYLGDRAANPREDGRWVRARMEAETDLPERDW